MSSFAEAARPLMEYLSKNHHPHTKVIVDSGHAEVVEGIETYNTNDFIKP